MRTTPRKRAATLVEIMCYILLMLLIVTGATMALIGTLRGAARISERSDKVRESARIVRRLSTDLNDASFAVLPTDSSSKRSWPLMAGTARLFISNIQGNASGSGSGETLLNTGILATIPGRYDLTLRNETGGAVALNGYGAPLRRTSTDGGVLIYRGKQNGMPDSKKGTHLWMKHLSRERLFSPPVLLSDQLSKNDDAVSFKIDQDGLIQAQLALQESALGGDEVNPITFTVELGNYTPDAGTQAGAFLGGS